MRKTVSLLLAFIMCLYCCACNSSDNGHNYEPTTDEDKMAYEILRQAVPDYKSERVDVISCGPCKVYENYEGGTLVRATVYDEDMGIGSTAYGLFDDTELREYFWYGTGIDKMEELRKATEQMEYTEFEVSQDVCDAVGVATYQETWESIATTMACDYLLEFMNYLKNPYTIEVNSVYCFHKPYGVYQAGSLDDALYFTVNYTAENNIGGKVTTTIGNTEGAGLEINSTSYVGSAYAGTLYFVEDETYARNQADSFLLNNEEIQEHILENY